MPAIAHDSGIDSSVSFLIGGLLLAGFVFLSLMGLNVLERGASSAARGPEPETPEVTAEIGDQ